MRSLTAHAGTNNSAGVTIHVQDGCLASVCVSLNAPGYGYYHGARPARIHKANKDTSRLASARKEDAATSAAPAAAATPTEATPAKTPEKAPDTVVPPAASDAAPAK
jgi:hypothetical protein